MQGRRTLVFWEAFTAISMLDTFWNFVPCGSSSNPKNPEDGGDFVLRNVCRTRGTRYKGPETKQTPWPLVRERTIPTERPPLVDEI
jgi:hypothetical protein